MNFFVLGKTIPFNQLKGNIVFNNIKFAYPSRPDAILFKNLNLTVPSGKIIF